jgi:hypothetical protein
VFDPNTLVGPFGALIVLGAVVTVMARAIQSLWRVHLVSDQDDRDQRDQALALVEGIIPALKDLAAGQAAANRDAVARHRRTDGR